MKKCPGCSMDVDKYAIACQYCKKLLERSLDLKENADESSVESERIVHEFDVNFAL